MRVGVIGLTGSGKTTLFNSLSGAGAPVATYSGPTGKSHLAAVAVPDSRLDTLAEIGSPKKVTPVRLDFEDFPGLALGPNEDRRGSRALLGHVRDADLLVIVLRAFEDPNVFHPLGGNDPARDLEEIDVELMVSDQEVVENRVPRLEKSLRKRGPDYEKEQREMDVIQRCARLLEAGRPLRELELAPTEEPLLNFYGLLSRKPRVAVINIGEELLGQAPPELDVAGPLVSICAGAEMEVRELPEDERSGFLQAMGVEETRAPAVLRACQLALKLITFFTMGDSELRAWSLPEGAHVIDAAGAIHTDMARGFIRSEVVAFQDMAELRSWQNLRTHGKLHLEGRDFVVRDGDILHIHFSA